MIDVTLSFEGGLADNHSIDLYDAARALLGFQRSLALTTHLVLHGDIITQAPALQGAKIITTAPEEGSWKVTAAIIATLWTAGTASKDTPFGHLLFSPYDYTVKETMGFHVDYDKSLGEQYDDYLREKKITKEKVDSLIEKTEGAISDIHRPIVGNETAHSAKMVGYIDKASPVAIGPDFSRATYEYIAHTVKSDNTTEVIGFISSYNSNTFKGRIFCFAEKRPIPFELDEKTRKRKDVNLITSNLRYNAVQKSVALNNGDLSGAVKLTCFRMESSTGRLKALAVNGVEKLQ